MAVPSVTLNNGRTMPMLGLGTWLSQGDKGEKAVIEAVKAGYRHVDGAWFYRNERELGRAFAELFNSNTIKRQDLFYTTKLWNRFHRPADVRPALLQSLQDTGLQYVDLYLMHWPVAAKKSGGDFVGEGLVREDEEVGLVETWSAMEKLVDEGLVKSIGVSNFTISLLEHFLPQCRIKPVVNQVESHPFLPQPDLLAYCNAHHIVIQAYTPLGNPSLSSSPAPSTADGSPSYTPLTHPVILSIAQKHAATPAQILLSWQLQRGVVVLPKSVTPSRIRENMSIIKLDRQDMDGIAGIEQRHRVVDGDKVFGGEVFGSEREVGADRVALERLRKGKGEGMVAA